MSEYKVERLNPQGLSLFLCLNITKHKSIPYPKETFTAVIWDSEKEISQKLSGIEGQTLCISGKVEEYKGKPRMVLKSLNQVV